MEISLHLIIHEAHNHKEELFQVCSRQILQADQLEHRRPSARSDPHSKSRGGNLHLFKPINMQGQDNVTYRDNVKQDALQTKHMTLMDYHPRTACYNRLNKHSP